MRKQKYMSIILCFAILFTAFILPTNALTELLPSTESTDEYCFYDDMDNFSWYIPTVERVERQYTYWCWVACAIMAGEGVEFVGKNVKTFTQTEVAASQGITSNESAEVEKTRDATNYVANYGLPAGTGLIYEYYDEKISWDNLTNSLWYGRPVIANIYPSSGTGHSIVIFGYQRINGVKKVIVYDPAEGVIGKKVINFADLKNGGGTMARLGDHRINYKWKDTIKVARWIDPTIPVGPYK